MDRVELPETAPHVGAAAPSDDSSPSSQQEVDLWWGSWSGWTMLPSVVICVVLTGVAVWWAWTYVDRRFVQLAVWGLAGAIWLVQSVRWSRKVFGHNYRLTTRRLIVWRGHPRPRVVMVDVAQIAGLRLERYLHSRWTGVARVVVRLTDGQEVALGGVRGPDEVVKLMEAACERR